VLKLISQQLTAGRRWTWTESFYGYDPNDFTLEILLKKADGNPIKITTSNNSGHLVDVSASTTAQILPGYYVYSAYVFEIAEPSSIIQVETGIVEVLPDPMQAGDVRTFAIKMVEKLEAALYALASNTMSTVAIDGRSYTYKDETELTKQLEYWQSRAGIKGASKRQRILTRFTNQ